MDFKSHAQNLAPFLQKWTPIWSAEIMNEYPEIMACYPVEWVDLLDGLTAHELFELDCKRPVDKLKGTSFQHFLDEIRALTTLEKIEEAPEFKLEAWAFSGVKKKKHHEIQKIVPVIRELRDERGFERAVDIGGGVGHLSRILAHYHHIPMISIDQNAHFQSIGRERLEKFRKQEGASDVTFLNFTFGDASNPLEKNIFSPQTFCIGLHTCGGLAHSLIQTVIDHSGVGLLNFGCCYYKMDLRLNFPLSAFYQKNDLPRPNLFALSLATRSHAAMSWETYTTKERVKYYRYALHLFLMRHFNNKYFTDVGECQISTYWRPFSFYIEEKLRELKLNHSFTHEDFNAFYAAPSVQGELKKMFLCNLIRWQLGRALEVYVQIDRCLYLEENGFQVTLKEYFKEEISPRNLGILALRKTP